MFISLIATCILGSCASLKSTSSGQIGCPPNEISITNLKRGWSSNTWTAVCRGEKYYCTSVATGQYSTQVNCKPEAKPSGDIDASDSEIGCNPICSPGYLCQGTICIPLCNPKCGPGMTCGQDRTCIPVSSPK